VGKLGQLVVAALKLCRALGHQPFQRGVEFLQRRFRPLALGDVDGKHGNAVVERIDAVVVPAVPGSVVVLEGNVAAFFTRAVQRLVVVIAYGVGKQFPNAVPQQILFGQPEHAGGGVVDIGVAPFVVIDNNVVVEAG